MATMVAEITCIGYGGSLLILGSPITGAISIACDLVKHEFIKRIGVDALYMFSSSRVIYLLNMCHQICSLQISLLNHKPRHINVNVLMYLQLDADCNDSL